MKEYFGNKSFRRGRGGAALTLDTLVCGSLHLAQLRQTMKEWLEKLQARE
jgi:hypothetical protein